MSAAMASGGLDVLVAVEDVVGVVAALDLREPRVVLLAVRGPHAVLTFVADEVEVDAAGRVLRASSPARPSPTRCAPRRGRRLPTRRTGGTPTPPRGSSSACRRRSPAATAPPHGIMRFCEYPTGMSTPVLTNAAIASSSKRGEVLRAPVVPLARRVVEHALELGVRHRADEVDFRVPSARSGAIEFVAGVRGRRSSTTRCRRPSGPAGPRARTARADR